MIWYSGRLRRGWWPTQKLLFPEGKGRRLGGSLLTATGNFLPVLRFSLTQRATTAWTEIGARPPGIEGERASGHQLAAGKLAGGSNGRASGKLQ